MTMKVAVAARVWGSAYLVICGLKLMVSIPTLYQLCYNLFYQVKAVQKNRLVLWHFRQEFLEWSQ